MPRSLLSTLLIVGVCLFTASCSGNVPDCGSDAVIKLAAKIASDHPQNKLSAYIRNSTPMHSAAIQELERKAHEGLGGGVECLPHPACDQERHSLFEKVDRLWDLTKNNVSYNFNTIRMKAKDADTGNLTCQAVMTADLSEWGSAKMDVTYTVERTTKGELYVTIYGLER